MKKNIYIIGTGPMSQAYTKALDAQGYEYTVIGRGEASAEIFKDETGIKPITGGIESYLKKQKFPANSYVIIATGTEVLMPVLKNVINGGATYVLIEKPGAISIEELLANEKILGPYLNRVFVAYNRRFYSSVIEAMKLINEDGGLKSMHFEFTEWAHKIEPIEKALGVKENWFFANSTHVVDLAFYIAGNPLDWKAFNQKGNLTWHSKSNFSGAGITEKNVLFSYISNWESAGRWGIELLTNKRRIYLKPLEGIAIQEKGSIQIQNHSFDNKLDVNYKPGIYKMVENFMKSEPTILTLNKHVKNSKIVYRSMISDTQ